MDTKHHWSRRRVLATALAGAAAWPVAGIARAGAAAQVTAAAAAGARPGHWLELYNTHTGETVAAALRAGGQFVAASLERFRHLLRDHRAHEEHEIDAELLEQLVDVARLAGREPRFEIISGYRSPATNLKLAAAGRGVATKSLHMQGRAVDVRLKGCDCARLRDFALSMERGGVGYYRRSDFVHLDTGRVRAWQG